jgi:hypothetical protein
MAKALKEGEGVGELKVRKRWAAERKGQEDGPWSLKKDVPTFLSK